MGKIQALTYAGDTPGADSNSYELFNSVTHEGMGAGFVRKNGLRSFALTLKNSHSGSVVASMRDASGTWQAFVTKPVGASPAGGSNSVVLEVGHCADVKVSWTNGGSAQTTWFVSMVLTDLDRDAFQLDDDEDVGGDFSVGGDVAVTGALAVTGETTLTDDVAMAGALAVTGAATVTGVLTAEDDAAVEGALDVTGAVTVGSTVDGRDIAADGTTLDATSRGYRAVRAITDQTDTTVLADAGKLLTCAHVTSTAVTIPPNASVAYAVGEHVDVAALSGAGAVTLTAGGGVTLTPATGKTLVLAAAGIARVTKLATNTWVVTGDLVAA